jgi:mannose-6-phosphate isomerase-like protein (cupin superfamily)
MKFEHIKPENIKKNDFGAIIVQNLFDEDGYDKFSIAKIKIIGEQNFGLDTENDTAYYVLEGDGKFYIEDDILEVKKEILFLFLKTPNTKTLDN